MQLLMTMPRAIWWKSLFSYVIVCKHWPKFFELVPLEMIGDSALVKERLFVNANLLSPEPLPCFLSDEFDHSIVFDCLVETPLPEVFHACAFVSFDVVSAISNTCCMYSFSAACPCAIRYANEHSSRSLHVRQVFTWHPQSQDNYILQFQNAESVFSM